MPRIHSEFSNYQLFLDNKKVNLYIIELKWDILGG